MRRLDVEYLPVPTGTAVAQHLRRSQFRIAIEMEQYLAYDENGVPCVHRGMYVLKVDLSDLDDEYRKKAETELRETPENVALAIEELKKLIRKNKKLNLPMDNDAFLIKFLRPCKFYPQSGYKLIKSYYNFLAKHIKYTTNLIPSSVEAVYANSIIDYLPVRSNGCRIMVFRASKWDPKEVDVGLVVKAVIMAVEIAMIEPRTQVSGVHVINDMEGLSIEQVLQFSPSIAMMILEGLQKCLPLRLKGIHVVNQPAIFKVLYSLFWPFLAQKLRKRVNFLCRNYDPLVRILGAECLPTCYGGNLELPEPNGKLMVEMIRHYDQDFIDIKDYGYNRSKV